MNFCVYCVSAYCGGTKYVVQKYIVMWLQSLMCKQVSKTKNQFSQLDRAEAFAIGLFFKILHRH